MCLQIYRHLHHLYTHEYRLKAAGPNEPVASNDTLEGMAQNRRVEIVFLKNELDLTDKDVIKDILEHDYGLGSGEFDENANSKPDIDKLPEGSVDKVIDYIDNSIKNNIVSGTTEGPSIIDSSQFVVSTDSESSE